MTNWDRIGVFDMTAIEFIAAKLDTQPESRTVRMLNVMFPFIREMQNAHHAAPYQTAANLIMGMLDKIASEQVK